MCLCVPTCTFHFGRGKKRCKLGTWDTDVDSRHASIRVLERRGVRVDWRNSPVSAPPSQPESHPIFLQTLQSCAPNLVSLPCLLWHSTSAQAHQRPTCCWDLGVPDVVHQPQWWARWGDGVDTWVVTPYSGESVLCLCRAGSPWRPDRTDCGDPFLVGREEIGMRHEQSQGPVRENRDIIDCLLCTVRLCPDHCCRLECCGSHGSRLLLSELADS